MTFDAPVVSVEVTAYAVQKIDVPDASLTVMAGPIIAHLA
jgi:hypothetical protein